MTEAGEFMIKSETEFLDKVRPPHLPERATRETPEGLRCVARAGSRADALMCDGDTPTGVSWQAADNAAVRETLRMLESAGKAEEEVLGQAWDLLAKLGAKRPTEGPGSQPMPEEEPPADEDTSSS